MGQGVNRFTPAMPVGSYKTYSISSPLSTHYRPASCDEVDCKAYQNGWKTRVLPGSDLEGAVRTSGRKWITEEKTEDGFLEFTFPPGQSCFGVSQHRVRTFREEVFSTRRGDWRADLGERYVHTKAEFWIEDMQENLAKTEHVRELLQEDLEASNKKVVTP